MIPRFFPSCLPFIVVVLSAVEVAPGAAPSASSAPVNPSGFVIHRGTNLSHWLSQDFHWAPRKTWITEIDIRFLARAGFDHVRLPVDEQELWQEDGKPDEAAFGLLQQAIGWCRANNLRVIVDLHTVRAHHFNAVNEGVSNTLWTDPKAQEHFVGLWRELSARLRTQPVDAVAYEIMNEPVADEHEQWNHLVAATLQVIRATEPARVVVIGSNRWQIPSTLPFLKVPEGDKNIILSIHTYSPMTLTHYGADWVPLKIYTGAVNYPGPILERDAYDRLMNSGEPGIPDITRDAIDDWGSARLQKVIEVAVSRARELGLQLYCGEFGCMPTVPRAARLAYYRDIVGVFEANGMAYANWEYKGDFGILEWHGLKGLNGAPDDELIDILLQKR